MPDATQARELPCRVSLVVSVSFSVECDFSLARQRFNAVSLLGPVGALSHAALADVIFREVFDDLFLSRVKGHPLRGRHDYVKRANEINNVGVRPACGAILIPGSEVSAGVLEDTPHCCILRGTPH